MNRPFCLSCGCIKESIQRDYCDDCVKSLVEELATLRQRGQDLEAQLAEAKKEDSERLDWYFTTLDARVVEEIDEDGEMWYRAKWVQANPTLRNYFQRTQRFKDYREAIDTAIATAREIDAAIEAAEKGSER